MSFNKLLEEAGEFGFFQKTVISGILFIYSVFWGVGYWTQVFVLVVPPHRCKLSENDTSWRPLDMQTMTSSECQLYSASSNLTSEGNLTDKTCPYGWIYDISDMYQTFPAEHNWVCNDSWKVYSTHTCYWIGSILGSIVTGVVIDKFGRKCGMFTCVILMLVGDIGTYFANSFVILLISRFIAAMGQINSGSISCILAFEFTGPKHRITFTSFASMCAAFIAIVSPFIVYALRDWHNILIVAWCTSGLTFLITCFVPESASWLAAKGRTDEAARIICKAAKLNGKTLPLEYVKGMLQEKKGSSTMKPDCIDNLEIKNTTGNNPKENAFFQDVSGLLRTPNMRKRMILLTLILMISCACMNGNSIELSNLPTSFRISYCIAGLSEVPGPIIWMLLLEKLGRRWTNIMFFVFESILSIILFAYVRDFIAMMIVISIIKLCIISTYEIMGQVAAELIPTVVRGSGITLVRIFGCIASSVAPFIVKMSEQDKLLPYLVFGILSLVAAMLTLLLADPTGESMPQTLEDGENFYRNQPLFNIPFLKKKKQNATTSISL